MIAHLRYWRGLSRLHFGFCPRCDSSPPERGCVVCGGDYDYGRPTITPEKRERWRQAWANECFPQRRFGPDMGL